MVRLGLGGVTLLVAFVARQLGAERLLLDLTIFRVRASAVTSAGLILQMLLFATAVVLTPFLLEGAMGLSPRAATAVFVGAAVGLFLGDLPGVACFMTGSGCPASPWQAWSSRWR